MKLIAAFPLSSPNINGCISTKFAWN